MTTTTTTTTPVVTRGWRGRQAKARASAWRAALAGAARWVEIVSSTDSAIPDGMMCYRQDVVSVAPGVTLTLGGRWLLHLDGLPISAQSGATMVYVDSLAHEVQHTAPPELILAIGRGIREACDRLVVQIQCEIDLARAREDQTIAALTAVATALSGAT